jgi:hypothetical protein
MAVTTAAMIPPRRSGQKMTGSLVITNSSCVSALRPAILATAINILVLWSMLSPMLPGPFHRPLEPRLYDGLLLLWGENSRTEMESTSNGATDHPSTDR